MGRQLFFLAVLAAVVVSVAPVAEAQYFFTSVERLNPDGNSGDTPVRIAPSPLEDLSPAFVDRTHAYTTIPDALLGAEYIQTANDDKDNPNHELHITIGQAGTLYLFIDNRVGTDTPNSPDTDPDLAGAGMTWVADLGFEDTGMNMAIDESADGDIDQWFSVFAKAATPGTIVMLQQDDGGGRNMYGVAMMAPRVKAYKPTPADGAEDVVMALFQWTAGDSAIFHKVYLGTTPDLTEADVVNPSTPLTLYYHVLGLVPGATYYWRVDEIEPDMVTVHEGDVWSFTSASITASKPAPPDGIAWVDPGVELSWKAGKDAFSHDIYFGTDQAAVESGAAEVFQGNQFLTTWAPAALDAETTYYWRIDEITATGTKSEGQVWSFVTLPAIVMTDPSLLASYKMDEDGVTAVDWSGYGHHATFGDPAPAWAIGQFGGALEFAGNGDEAVCADGSFLNGLDALTVTAWVKSNVTNSDKGFIIFATPAGNDDQDMRYDAAGATGGGTNLLKMGVTVLLADGTNSIVQLESSNESQTTEWQHLAMVWSSGQAIQLYINGNLDAATASSTAVVGTLTGFANVVIGKGGKDSATSSWNGLVDEIRIYDKALTQDDIQLIMRGDPLLAWDPSPSNGAKTDVLQALPLTWQRGDIATKHAVYFGTDRAAVIAADASDTTGIYRGQQSGTSFTPAEALEWGQQYFWRVDEINSDGTTSPGFVWAFTLAEYLIVDEFEGYTNFSPNRVFQTWIDGWGFSEDEWFPAGNPGNGSNALVGYDPLVGDVMETGSFHGGRQSMPLEYNNVIQPYYSETERTWVKPQNWTVGGVTDLSLWFQGNPVGYVETATGITMSASGVDIWGTADEFRFAYKRLTGNGSITVKVESVGNTNGWAKAGVMIRRTLEPGSRFAYVVATPAQGVSFGRRPMTDSACESTTQAGIPTPHWVKLTRTGDTYKAEQSIDGQVWQSVGTDVAASSADIAMVGTLYIGLCVTSHNASAVTTAEFSNITTSGGVSGPWQMAEIGIDHPDNAPADLYVALQDSAGRVGVETWPDGTIIDVWQQWKIPLSVFSGKGVNLSAIKKMFIGVGNRNTPTPDGAGMLFIDDIQVLPPEPAEPEPTQ